MTRVLVIGGAGYCGSVLVPQLLDEGYSVTIYDILWYGSEFLPLDNPALNVIQGGKVFFTRAEWDHLDDLGQLHQRRFRRNKRLYH